MIHPIQHPVQNHCEVRLGVSGTCVGPRGLVTHGKGGQAVGDLGVALVGRVLVAKSSGG